MPTPVSNDWWPRFSAAEYERRYATVRAAMAERGLDALLVYGTSIYFGSDPGSPNLAFLAGYGPACHGYVLLPLEGDPTLLVFVPNHLENAIELSVIADVRAGNDLVGNAVKRFAELGSPPERVGIVGNFGFSGASIPLEHHQALMAQLPDTGLEIVTTWYEDLRLLKSDEELVMMRDGARITDRAHELLRARVRPGVTDVSLQLGIVEDVHEMRARVPFSHVGSTSMRQPRLRYPSFYATNRVVQRGDVVMTEMSAGPGGYFGKIYGTLAVSEPTPVYRTMFELASGIYHAIYDTVRPGMAVRDVDPVLDGGAQAAGLLSISSIAGWSTYNTRPSKSALGDGDQGMELRPGQCLNVAGWVLDQDRRYGVWLGDTAVVTEHGLESLHAYPVAALDHILLDC